MPKHHSTAKVVDGSLILSLPDATIPVVMRLSLEEAKSAAFTVIEKDNKFILRVTLSEKDSRDIAPYEEKEKAVSALMAASSALEKGSRYASNDNRMSGDTLKNIAKWGAALGVLFFLYVVISSLSSSLPRAPITANVQNQMNNAPATSANAPTATSPRATTGVAVPADQFLSATP
jgi:hypothetical protein